MLSRVLNKDQIRGRIKSGLVDMVEVMYKSKNLKLYHASYSGVYMHEHQFLYLVPYFKILDILCNLL